MLSLKKKLNLMFCIGMYTHHFLKFAESFARGLICGKKIYISNELGKFYDISINISVLVHQINKLIVKSVIF